MPLSMAMPCALCSITTCRKPGFIPPRAYTGIGRLLRIRPGPSAWLRGSMVLDAVYGPDPTPLVEEARRRGLAAVDGFELLVQQAVLQFEHMTGSRPSVETMAEAGRRWLESRRLPASA